MSYTTQQRLIERYGDRELIQLTDRYNSGVLDSALLDAAIDAADRLIDGYIHPRHGLPLAQAMIDASALPEQAAAIVRYGLYDDHAPEEVVRRYRDALNWLRDVQAGRVTLGEQDAVATTGGRMQRGQGVSGFDWDDY